MTTFLAARNRLRARPLHRRPGRGQARRRHRAQEPLAAPADRGAAQRGGSAEEHSHDRPDRRRQDGDLAAARARSPGAPFLESRGDQVHRGRLRRPRRRQHYPRSGRGGHRRSCAKPSARSVQGDRPRRTPRSACSMRSSARPPRPATRESFRKKLRNNELNDKEIEIHVCGRRTAACRCSTLPRHAGRRSRRRQPRRDAEQGDGRLSSRSRAASPCRTATTS